MRIGTAALCIFLCGCASEQPGFDALRPAVFSHRDPAADLSAYRTYAFMQPLGTDAADGSPTRLGDLLVAALDAELRARGLRRAEDPDLLVNLDVQTEQKLAAGPAGPPPRYRRGRYRQWRGHEATSLEYTQGTLSIDLVDAESRAVVWEGLAQGPLQGELDEISEARVRDLVRSIFERFEPDPAP